MSTILDAYAGDRALLTALIVLTQVTLICALTLLAVAVLKWRGAALRHQVCAWAIAIVCVTPVLSPVLSELGIGLFEVEPPRAGATLPAVIRGPGDALLDAGLERPHATSRSKPSQQSEATKVGIAIVEPVPAERAGTRAEPARAWIGLMHASVASSLVTAAAVVWIAGSVAMLLGLLHGFLRERRLRRLCTSQPVPGIQQVLADVRRELGVRSLPPVLLSPQAGTPMALGFGRPVVLLPRSFQTAPRSELRAVLLHEMAHIVRHDHWMGLLQRLAAAAFWPHPLVHLVNRRLCRAREEICDNHVLRCEDAPDYARVLLGLSSHPEALVAPATASGLARPGWRLEERVAELLDERRNTMTSVRPSIRGMVSWFVFAASVLVVAGCNLRVASDQPLAVEAVAVRNAEGTPSGSPPATLPDIERIRGRFKEAMDHYVAGRPGTPDSASNLAKAIKLFDEVIEMCDAAYANVANDPAGRVRIESIQSDASRYGYNSRKMRTLLRTDPVKRVENRVKVAVVPAEVKETKSHLPEASTRTDIERIDRRFKEAVDHYGAGRRGTPPDSDSSLTKAATLFDEVIEMCDAVLANAAIGAADRERIESVLRDAALRRFNWQNRSKNYYRYSEKIPWQFEYANSYFKGYVGESKPYIHLAVAKRMYLVVARMCDEAVHHDDSIDAADRARMEPILAEASLKCYNARKMMLLKLGDSVPMNKKREAVGNYFGRDTLRWSVRRQSPDGSWPSHENGGGAGMDVADTALMLLASLAIGNAETKGKHKDSVRRALVYLKSRQSEDGLIGRGLWTRSLTTLALSSAYEMDREPETGRAAQKALDALSAQISSTTAEQRQRLARGEWPDGPASMALATMALHSGRRSDLRVGVLPRNSMLSMISDLDREARTPLNAAASLVMRRYTGSKRSDPEVVKCAQILAANLPRWEEGKMDFRYFYLGTVGMYGMGGDDWKRWHAAIRDMLIERQIYNNQEHDGAWQQADVISSETATVSPRASRTYAFASCILTLTVYYRYLPVYKHFRAPDRGQ